MVYFICRSQLIKLKNSVALFLLSIWSRESSTHRWNVSVVMKNVKVKSMQQCSRYWKLRKEVQISLDVVNRCPMTNYLMNIDKTVDVILQQLRKKI